MSLLSVLVRALMHNTTMYTSTNVLSQVGMVPPQEQYAIIPYLVVDRVYEFHVVGVNVAGRGEPSEASPPVCIKPTRGSCSLLSCVIHVAIVA